jgi:hypothetical protein
MEYIISDSYDGQTRKLFKVSCGQCQKEIYRPKNRLKNKNYCSVDCSRLSRRKRVKLICSFCHIDFERAINKAAMTIKGYYFCSRICKDSAQRVGGILAIQPTNYKDGVRSYRSRALRIYGEICKSCRYNKDVRMLDVDHIDGNRKNSKIENLMVLCVWCHAYKTRLGSLPKIVFLVGS